MSRCRRSPTSHGPADLATRLVPSTGPPVILSGLELGSGPISESEDDSPLTAGVIPEPATMSLFAFALAGAAAGWIRRRRVGASG